MPGPAYLKKPIMDLRKIEDACFNTTTLVEVRIGLQSSATIPSIDPNAPWHLLHAGQHAEETQHAVCLIPEIFRQLSSDNSFLYGTTTGFTQ